MANVHWLMIRREPMSAYEAEYVNGFVETMRIDYESDPGDVFANLTVIYQERTYPIILDFALGYEHVFIQGQPSA